MLVRALLVCPAILSCGIGLADTGTPQPKTARISGTFVFDGPVPAVKQIGIAGRRGALLDESLVINPINHGVKNVIIYLRQPADGAGNQPAPQPPVTNKVALEIKDGRFVPHVSLLQTNQQLVIRNSEATVHNFNLSSFQSPTINRLLQPLEIERVSLTRAERVPVPIQDNITPWLKGWLLVQDHPFMVTSDENGNFAIAGLPVDRELQFQLWHERTGPLKAAALESRDLKSGKIDKRRLTIRLKNGKNDIGTIRIRAAAIVDPN